MEELIKDHFYVLILCGGGGTRLWPRSRQKTPKQFLENFLGKETIFTQTVERAQLLTSDDKIFVVTTQDYVDEVVRQGKVILPRNIIAEPEGKNTAMAMGVGAAYIRKLDPDGIILNFASDAAIENEPLFTKRMLLAAQVAASGTHLVAVGIKPTFPHTGLGYLETGKNLKGFSDDVFKVSLFKEKPDLETAQKFLKQGNYYWNANLYVWSVEAIWQAFRKFQPAIFASLEKIYEAIGTEEEKGVLLKEYKSVENISLDYAISEKADNLLLVPATFPWSDVGDWQVIYDLKKKDKEGNVVETFGEKGWHLGIETKNCLIESENRLIATIGVLDLVIVETEEAILVCRRQVSQEVKKMVSLLKEKKKTEYL